MSLTINQITFAHLLSHIDSVFIFFGINIDRDLRDIFVACIFYDLGIKVFCSDASWYSATFFSCDRTFFIRKKKVCYSLTVCMDFIFLFNFVEEQFREALGNCITLSHSIIDIDATWITEQYNLFCTVSIDLVQ